VFGTGLAGNVYGAEFLENENGLAGLPGNGLGTEFPSNGFFTGLAVNVFGGLAVNGLAGLAGNVFCIGLAENENGLAGNGATAGSVA